jgi:hypothetical protein
MQVRKISIAAFILLLSGPVVAECVAAGKVKSLFTRLEASGEIYETVRIVTPVKHLFDFVHSSPVFSAAFRAAYNSGRGLTVGGDGFHYGGQCLYVGDINNGKAGVWDGGYVQWVSQGK